MSACASTARKSEAKLGSKTRSSQSFTLSGARTAASSKFAWTPQSTCEDGQEICTSAYSPPTKPTNTKLTGACSWSMAIVAGRWHTSLSPSTETRRSPTFTPALAAVPPFATEVTTIGYPKPPRKWMSAFGFSPALYTAKRLTEPVKSFLEFQSRSSSNICSNFVGLPRPHTVGSAEAGTPQCCNLVRSFALLCCVFFGPGRNSYTW
mmetsp:Transcript_36982/g.85331  ORF Transcript_36982/g.85331 Transcript_36982/m.85331 type:complete len:207 (+) Transcript_36982:274-894(+)